MFEKHFPWPVTIFLQEEALVMKTSTTRHALGGLGTAGDSHHFPRQEHDGNPAERCIPGANCKAGGKQREHIPQVKNWPWLLSHHRHPALFPFLRVFSILKSRKPMKNRAYSHCRDLFLQHLQQRSGFLPNAGALPTVRRDAEWAPFCTPVAKHQLNRFSVLDF